MGVYSPSCLHVSINYLTVDYNVAVSALKTGLTNEYSIL